jgi:hypothetical protein
MIMMSADDSTRVAGALAAGGLIVFWLAVAIVETPRAQPESDAAALNANARCRNTLRSTGLEAMAISPLSRPGAIRNFCDLARLADQISDARFAGWDLRPASGGKAYTFGGWLLTAIW